MRLVVLTLAILALPAQAELAVRSADDGSLSLADGGPLGRLLVAAWDRDWAYNSVLSDLDGRLPGTLTATLRLPGQATGEAQLEMALEQRDDLYRFEVFARFTADTELNAFAVELSLPLQRLLGRAVRAVPEGPVVSIAEEPFGATIAAPALAAEVSDREVLLFGAVGTSILVQDNRRFGSDTVALRHTLISGKIRAGTRVRQGYVLALCPASEAAEKVRSLMPPIEYDASRPALLARADGVLTLLGPNTVRRATIRLAVHGREWALQQQDEAEPPSTDLSAERRTYLGRLDVPKTTGGVIEYEETVRPTADGFRLEYTVTRRTPLPLNSHHVSWHFPLDPILGQSVTLVGDGEMSVALPREHDQVHLAASVSREVRLWPDRPDGAVIRVDPPLDVLVQDNRRFGINELELRFRLGQDFEADLPAGETRFTLDIRPTTPTQVLLAGELVQQKTDTIGWAAYTLPWDGCPVDLSFLNDKPAGEHGFLECRDGRFVFADGTEARFWGTCFSAGANFPTHEQSEKIARRLARFGVNIVRTHHADANWAEPNFFAFEGQGTGTTTEFRPESLDRFDYLMHCLKEEGIYIYLDQLVHRKFTAADGVDAPDQLDNAAKPYSNFDPQLIAVQQAFSRNLLNHVNPYTKLAYHDDPAIVLMEFANENDLMTQRVTLEPYRSRLERRYREWAAKNGVEVPAGPVEFDLTKTPVLRFLVAVQADYYDQMTRFMRDLGVRIPLTGSNWSRNAGLLAALDKMPYTDSHAYHNHPHGGRFGNQSYVGRERNMTAWLSFNRVAGKPFFVSEWDTPWPNEYRAELPLWIAAVAALQSWGGLTVYTYRHTAEVPVDHLSGSFETFNDPCRFGLFPAAALIFRRGDVAPARETVTVRIPRERALTAPSPSAWSTPALVVTPEVHRVEVTLGEAGAGKVVEWNQRAVEPSTAIASDTGEITRRFGEQGWGTIDTPRTQAAYGFLGSAGGIALGDVRLRIETPFAVVAVSSLTDQPIRTSTKLLVTAVARAENTGYRYNATRNGTANAGAGPILIEPVAGELSIASERRGWRVVPLAPDGARRPNLAATVSDQRLTFSLGAAETIYYLLEAE